MSTEMPSQGSDQDSDYEQSDQDDDLLCYYNNDVNDLEIDKPKSDDTEQFDYELLTVEDVERLLNEEVEYICSAVHISPALSKMLLQEHGWQKENLLKKHTENPARLLVDSNIMPSVKFQDLGANSLVCAVCTLRYSRDRIESLTCGHGFCKECWDRYFQVQIQQGVTTGIQCMASDCNVLVPENVLCDILSQPDIRDRYMRLTFMDHVKTHPELRFCPGPNCPVIVRAAQPLAKKVECSKCKTSFCFRCGIEYHAPTDCSTIKRWLTKCADDSETANYISAHTKDFFFYKSKTADLMKKKFSLVCPRCHVCIEKNGGCNHMQCSRCKHDFCWMCLGDWKTHGSEYYECSRYKENPNIANESAHAQAREALKKYLFYFERFFHFCFSQWENHAKSLKLEEQTLNTIKSRIQEKVMNNSGTWIDWQYLLDAASLLKKCRYTLQYTYPYAYYMEKGARKQLFEYQQAQLEAEVENLSWKIERAEITDRGDLENQMDVAEKRRLTLLKDFLEI